MSKADLENLKIQSFVTSLDNKQDQTIKGGNMAPPPSATYNPRNCAGCYTYGMNPSPCAE